MPRHPLNSGQDNCLLAHLRDAHAGDGERLFDASSQLLVHYGQETSLVAMQPITPSAAPQLQTKVDAQRLEAFGVASADMDETLAIIGEGVKLGQTSVPGRKRDVYLHGAEGDGWSVRGSGGELIELHHMVTAYWRVGPTILERHDGRDSAALYAEPAAEHSLEEAQEALTRLAQQLPEGIDIAFSACNTRELVSRALLPLIDQ